MDSGQQASPVFTIILSFLNMAYTLLEQPNLLIKAASACILEGLHTECVSIVYKTFTSVKNKLLTTLTYSIRYLIYIKRVHIDCSFVVL